MSRTVAPIVLLMAAMAGPDGSSRERMDTQPAPPSNPATSRQSHVELSGVRLWVEDSGGSGETVVFLHAATGSTRSWEHQVPAVSAAGYRVLAYDRRGFGRTTVAPGVQAGTAADDLAALVDQLGLDRVHLVGVAAGGFVALDFAVSFPSRLHSLVVANSMGLIQDAEFLEVGRRIRSPEFESLPLAFKELSPSYRAANPEGTRRWIEIATSNRPAGAAATAQPVRNRMTAALLRTIRVPTLLIAGEADFYMPPPLMRMIAANIPQAETAVLPETAHAAFWEQPDLFNRRVLEFIHKH